eukprot:scaffold42377_cov63-Phaeocystis_antarctica.AAC.2
MYLCATLSPSSMRVPGSGLEAFITLVRVRVRDRVMVEVRVRVRVQVRVRDHLGARVEPHHAYSLATPLEDRDSGRRAHRRATGGDGGGGGNGGVGVKIGIGVGSRTVATATAAAAAARRVGTRGTRAHQGSYKIALTVDGRDACDALPLLLDTRPRKVRRRRKERRVQRRGVGAERVDEAGKRGVAVVKLVVAQLVGVEACHAHHGRVGATLEDGVPERACDRVARVQLEQVRVLRRELAQQRHEPWPAADRGGDAVVVLYWHSEPGLLDVRVVVVEVGDAQGEGVGGRSHLVGRSHVVDQHQHEAHAA